MNLADMLSYADIEQLSHIAKHYDCECNPNSKRELIQSILRKINQREIYEHFVSRLSIEELRFLNSLLFEHKSTAFSLEELIARAKQTKFTDENDASWNPRDVISKFKQRGWLFNGYSRETKYLFHVPQDLKQRFSDVLSSRFQQSIIYSHEPSIYRDEQSLMQDDVTQLLHYVSVTKIALSAEGHMYRKQLLPLLERMAVREDMVSKEVWRFGYGRRFKYYPNRLSFIYDYCYDKDYIIENDQQLLLTAKGQTRLDSVQSDEPYQLFRYWLSLYSKPIKNLASFVYWIHILAKRWVTVASVQHVLIHLIKPYYYDSAQVILEKRIIQMMMHLGMLRIGHHDSDGYIIQMTEHGTHLINKIYVNHIHNS